MGKSCANTQGSYKLTTHTPTHIRQVGNNLIFCLFTQVLFFTVFHVLFWKCITVQTLLTYGDTM